MSRSADTDQPRTEYVRTRITPAEKRMVEVMRGSVSESEFVRRLILLEAERRELP